MNEHDGDVTLAGAPNALHGALGEYAALIRETFGANAQSLTLFGAAARPDFVPSRRTARNVLVVQRVDLTALRRISEHGPRFGKSGIAAPLIMTRPYIAASLDTFPLELLEIQQAHRVIFGEDEFAALTFEGTAVRLQCERDLKAMLIGLRQGLLASAGRGRVLGALEIDAAEGLMRTLHGMAWLSGEKEALTEERAIAATERIIDRKLAGVRAALRRDGQHDWHAFEQLYGDVEALGEYVNAWRPTSA